MSDDPGRLRLGKGVTCFVKAKLKRLPQTEDVWQADFQPFPEAGKVRVRRRPCWLGVVLSQTDDFILADEILYRPPGINDLARLVADGMRRPLIETAHRPSRLALRDNPLWQELLPHLRELRIEVVLQDELPEWDAMLADFARDQKRSR
jgi:hypothetical protein